MGADDLSVLILNDTAAYAGTEKYIFDLTTALRSKGERVAVACPQTSTLGAKLSEAGLRVVDVHPVAWNLRAVKTVASLLRGGSVRLLHANNGRTALFAAVATSIAGSGRTVMTQHFLEPMYAKRRGLKAALSNRVHHWVDRRMTHVIANSHASGKGVLERGEASADSVTVIPNGVPAPDRSSLQSATSIRRAIGVSDTAPLIVCAARLEPEKDVATLIDAMASVVREMPDAVCVVAGEGRLRGELDHQIARLKLSRNVRLLGFRTDVLSIMNAADLFVLPSLAEPFGLALVEAMSLGKPCVAVAAGGPLEIVDDGETGLLVPPRNALRMAAAFLELLNDSERRLAMGRDAEARYSERFTVDRMAEQTIDVYRRVLGEGTKDFVGAVAGAGGRR